MMQHYYYHLKNSLIEILNHSNLVNNRKKIRECIKNERAERCFIVATGPSINNFDFSPIKNDVIIGVNTLYRGLDRLGFEPKYYVFTDERVFFENGNYEKVIERNTKVFVGASIYYTVIKKKMFYDNLFFVKPLGIITPDRFSRDILKGAYKGHSVVIFALQLAYSLGFKKVYLVGADYTTTDGKHFDGNAYDFKLNAADYPKQYRMVFESYNICNDYFKRDGREIINLSPQSNLPIFPKQSINEVFNGR